MPNSLSRCWIFLDPFACREQQLAEGSLALGNYQGREGHAVASTKAAFTGLRRGITGEAAVFSVSITVITGRDRWVSRSVKERRANGCRSSGRAFIEDRMDEDVNFPTCLEEPRALQSREQSFLIWQERPEFKLYLF